MTPALVIVAPKRHPCPGCGQPQAVYNPTDYCATCQQRRDLSDRVRYARIWFRDGSGTTGHHMLDLALDALNRS